MIIYIDTNVFVHFKPFDEVDWLSAAKAEAVTIVVTQVVLTELDALKGSHTFGRVRRRIAAILKKVERFLEDAGQVREGVRLEFEESRQGIDFPGLRLNENLADDILLANAWSRISESSDNVLIASDDSTVRLKAKRLGLNKLQIPDAWRLPDELDEAEKENRKLERELLELKTVQPVLDMVFDDGQKHKKFHLTPAIPIIEDVDSKIRELKTKYPNLPVPKLNQDPENPIRNMAFALDHVLSPQPADIEKYNNDLKKYFAEYAAYLNKQREYAAKKCLTIEIRLSLSNTGTIPAEDIEVSMHFSDGFMLLDKSSYPVVPREPDVPMLHSLVRDVASWQLQAPAIHFPRETYSLPPGGSLKIRKTNSYDVSLKVDRLKHNYVYNCGPMFAIFESRDLAKSFGITYEIYAANCPKSSNGSLNVVITK